MRILECSAMHDDKVVTFLPNLFGSLAVYHLESRKSGK
jgi:hypothetical protein